MTSTNAAVGGNQMSVRQAARIAGVAYLLNPVSYAEFHLYPKLVISGNVQQTIQNISAHGHLFVAAIFCYLLSFIGDVVIAWALYHLLAPVNRALSLLMAWFQLVYAGIALVGVLQLAAVFRMLNTPEYGTVFSPALLQAQVMFLLHSFRYDWSMSLILFGIHLVLLGWLVFRSGYIPRFLGALLIINGLGWIVDSCSPYLYPNAHLDFLFATFFGEIFFLVWLLVWGWRIREPEGLS